MQYRIEIGSNSSNIQYVINDIYDGQTLPQRFENAIALLGPYVYFYLFLLLSLPVLTTRFRHIVVFLIFPYSLLWAFYLSYEPRNLAVAFPLVGLASGVALESWLARRSTKKKPAARVKVPAYALAGVGLLVVLLLGWALDGQSLIDKQLKEQRLIFQASLNDKLYRYFSRQDGPEPIITDYPIDWLPDLKGYWRLERFENYEAYQATLLKHPQVELVLIPIVGIDQRILDEIYAFIESGFYEQILVDGNYLLVRIPPR
jgi:hypothetical protein